MSRVLGHPEILESEKWTVTDECFICDRWKYALFIYRREDDKNEGKNILNTKSSRENGGKISSGAS